METKFKLTFHKKDEPDHINHTLMITSSKINPMNDDELIAYSIKLVETTYDADTLLEVEKITTTKVVHRETLFSQLSNNHG